MKDFRRLELWQQAHALALEMYRSTSRFPQEEKFGLSNQRRRAAASISANLAKGCGRSGDADFARFVRIAFGSAGELECQPLLARDLGFIPLEDHTKVEGPLMGIKRMLAALVKKLKADH